MIRLGKRSTTICAILLTMILGLTCLSDHCHVQAGENLETETVNDLTEDNEEYPSTNDLSEDAENIEAYTSLLTPVQGSDIVDSGKMLNYDNLSWTLDTAGTLTLTISGTIRYIIGLNGLSDFYLPYRKHREQIKKLVIKGTGDVEGFKGPIFSDLPALEAVEISATDFGGVISGGTAPEKAPFYGCHSLKSIKVKKGKLASDGGNNVIINNNGGIHTGCKNTVIPAGTRAILSGAFAGQKEIQNAILPQGVESIYAFAWSDCTNLRYAVIPDSVTYTRPDIFSGCTALTDVYYGGTREQWDELFGNAGADGAEIHCNYDLSLSVPVCRVSFDSKGGSDEDDALVIENRTLNTLPVPVKKAFVFEGWFQDKDYNTPFESGKTVITEDITLYAKWRDALNLTVSFYTGDDILGEVPLYEGETVTPPGDIAKEGYRLEGWYLEKDLIHPFIISSPVTDNLSLYARWVDSSLPSTWTQSAILKTGSVLMASLYYNNETVYDGRKHAVKGTAKSSKSINPDIQCDSLWITINGVRIDGISIKGYRYRNNVKPAPTYKDTEYMQLIPVIKYDAQNQNLKNLLKEEKDLKKTLSSLLSPPLSKNKEGEWKGYVPILVKINRINLSKDMTMVTMDQWKQDQALQTADGILIYNGKYSVSWKKMKIDSDEYASFPVSGTAGNLVYQTIYSLEDGTRIVKHIKLRAGKWSVKKYGSYDIEMTAGGPYDYIIDEKMRPGDRILSLDTCDVYGTNYFKKVGYFEGVLPPITRDDEEVEKTDSRYY